MKNIFIILIIFIISIVFGTVHYKAGYYEDIYKKNKYFKFMEWWRVFVNYLITF